MRGQTALSCLFLLLLAPAQSTGAPHVNNGIRVSTEQSSQTAPIVVADGLGGAFVCWSDSRLAVPTVRVQRVNGAGAPLWGDTGLEIAPFAGDQSSPRMIADGQGGVYVAWRDTRTGVSQVHAQRVSAGGTLQWTSPGVRPIPNTVSQSIGGLTLDGSGGVVVGLAHSGQAYVQRLNGSGARAWSTSGANVGSGFAPGVTLTAAGFIGCAWRSTNIVGQLLNLAGQPQWTLGGVFVSGAPAEVGDDNVPLVFADGTDGFIVGSPSNAKDFNVTDMSAFGSAVWQRTLISTHGSPSVGPSTSLGGTRLESGYYTFWWGNLYTYLWGNPVELPAGRMTTHVCFLTPAGVIVSGAPWIASTEEVIGYSPPLPTVAGAALSESTVVCLAAFNARLRLHRVTLLGAQLDGASGLAAISTSLAASNPAVASDQHGLFLSWSEPRYGPKQVFFQHRNKQLAALSVDPEVPSSLRVVDVPMDEGGRVRVTWDASLADMLASDRVTTYDVLRAVAWTPSNSARVQREMPFAFSASGVDYYWETVAQVQARGLEGYGVNVQTLADSSVESSGDEYFAVQAWDTLGSPDHWWVTPVVAGHSKDNLAPVPPGQAQGTYSSGSMALSWSPSPSADAVRYRVYRAGAPGGGFGAVLIYEGSDLSFVDPAGGAFNYSVDVLDRSGNASPQTQFVLSGVTDVEAVPTVFGARLLGNPSTSQRVVLLALPSSVEVLVDVFDLAGRRVSSSNFGQLPPGVHKLTLPKSSAGGALQFLRVRAGTHEQVLRAGVLN